MKEPKDFEEQATEYVERISRILGIRVRKDLIKILARDMFDIYTLGISDNIRGIT